MQKVSKALASVICKLLWIGFGVQIVLGLCWMVTNMGAVQQFGETARYLEASKSFIENGYRGFLYPLLIMLAQGMEQLVRIPYHCFIYLLQLAMGFWAAWCLLDAVGFKGKCRLCYGSFTMLTVPMAMQCHLAVLPDSLKASFFLMELAYTIRCLRGESGKRMSMTKYVCVFYALGVCLLPEVLVVGAIPVCVVLIHRGIVLWKGTYKRAILRLVAWSVLFLQGACLVATAGEHAPRSAGSVMVSRFAWSHVEEDYGYWPEEVRKYIPFETACVIGGYADSVDRILVQELTQRVGEERTEELLRSLAEVSFGRHTKENLTEILWDMYGYGFAPWVLREHLEGKGYETYSGRNYEIMGMHTPGLTGYYMHYGSYLFLTGVFLAALLQMWRWLENSNRLAGDGAVRSKSAGRQVTILLLLGAIFTVLSYSMQGAGMMDYKKTICVTLLWTVWMLKCPEGDGTSDVVE